MDPLEKIIGPSKFQKLNKLEKYRIAELLVANPIYVHMVSEILDASNWRRVLGQAYLKYVKPKKSSAKNNATQTTQHEKSVIFGVGDSDQYTKSSIML